jgi:glycine C-acetyltransferase
MRALGFDTARPKPRLTPVMLGDVQLAREFSRRLFDEGLFAMALGFPTVPMGTARIRVMLSAHTVKAT